MVLAIIIQMTKLARFAKEVWHETRRLRRAWSGPAEE